MGSGAQSTRKAELRALARRLGSGDRASASAEAIFRLAELPEFVRARTLACYAAIGDEVPVERVAESSRARGVKTVFPVQVADELEFASIGDLDSLRPGRAGVREPVAAAPRVRIAEIDVFLVPGLLFDRSCRRLGRGGGHYDRLLRLARADATAIGICYAERVIEELPEDSWDVAMEVVVTERFVLRRPLRGSGA